MRVADECKTASALARRYARQIKGKTVLTTGVSPGSLGAMFVRAVAAEQPGLLVLAGRNAARLQETANSLGVRTRLLDVDLESMESVRDAAATVMSWHDVSCVDVFVNSAGVMATEYGVSPEGHESQLAVNHLGPWLFVNLIMEKILASRAPRVVLVGSEGHRLSGVRFDDVNFREGQTYNRWQAYGQTKTMNMLMAMELARMLGKTRNLQAFSLTPGPGASPTHLADHIDWTVEFEEMLKVDRFQGNWQGWLKDFPLSTPDEGAAVFLVAAFDEEIGKTHNGGYLYDCHPANPYTETVKSWGTSPVEAERLWRLTERLVGQQFRY